MATHGDSAPPLVVSGLGLTTALGRGVEANWQALVAGECGLRPIRSIDTSGLPVREGGEAPEPATPASVLEPFLPAARARDPRVLATRHMADVAREALRRAGLAAGRAPDPSRTALVAGSSLAASSLETEFWRDFAGRGPAHADYGALWVYDVEPILAALSEQAGASGESFLVSNACAAGASAIAAAADLLLLERCDLAIAIGGDLLDLHTLAGFASIKALAPGPVLPFRKGRAGMKLGSGFAALVLEREDGARRAGRRPLARLAGSGESADAHHLTHPDPEGRGAALAMRRALAMAGLDAAAIDHVSVHGTATASNDLAEFRAMRAIFGEERIRTLPLGASKPAIGHTLGASGAVEAAIALLALERQHLPPTVGAREGEPDPEIGPLDLIPEGRPARLRHVMSNAFGFGGCNTSLIFSAIEPEVGHGA